VQRRTGEQDGADINPSRPRFLGARFDDQRLRGHAEGSHGPPEDDVPERGIEEGVKANRAAAAYEGRPRAMDCLD